MTSSAPDGTAEGVDDCLACGSPIQRTGAIEATRPHGAPAPVGYCPTCRNLQLLEAGRWSPLGPAGRRER